MPEQHAVPARRGFRLVGDDERRPPLDPSRRDDGDGADGRVDTERARGWSGPIGQHPGGPVPADAAWPSQWWTGHDCANRRRCEHSMPLPEWWLLMASRGMPFHPDAETAFEMAKTRIRTYKGSQPVFDDETRALVQGIVLDALVSAPQPVTGGWVHTSLMTVGGLTRWALLNGEPLTREHLLSVHTRNRFLNLGCKGLKDNSVRNYRCRLDLIAGVLSGTPMPLATTRLLKHSEPVDPHTNGDVATLWVWAQGLRPQMRRDRLVATLVLSLGCGLRSSELIRVRPLDVFSDGYGVHLNVEGKTGDRLVTCDEVWETRLLDVVAATPANALLTSPWRETVATARGLQNAVRLAQREYQPPVLFSPRSLRNTWLVERLTAGTPVPTLLDAAGIESIEGLKPFLTFIPTPTTGTRAATLRGRA